jgi:hypothetical protein
MESEKLKEEFHEAMLNIYRRAKSEAGYNASRFLSMVVEDRTGGIATAKYLIHLQPPSEGYTALQLRHRLDLTVEAVIADNPKWHPLFTPEDLAACDKRLRDVEYLK